MAKKKKRTTNGQIRSALRLLSLRSPERAEALRRDGYTCQLCHKKQSKAKGKEVKVCVHHLHGEEEANWGEIIKVVRQFLLCNSEDLLTLCVECHEKLHKGEP